MFDSNFFPPGGPQYGSFLIMLAIPAVGILGMIMIIRMRKGTKQVFRTGALPGRITGATVTAKHVGTSDTMGKEPYLALHIEYFEDGRTHSITEPPAYNLTMVDKVRKQFVDHGRYDLGRWRRTVSPRPRASLTPGPSPHETYRLISFWSALRVPTSLQNRRRKYTQRGVS